MKKYKIALVLSGGGVRGFAHLGVIKALNEYGIYPDIIAGTSAGAIAAALYADGYKPDEAVAIFKEKELLKYIELIIPRTSLVKMTGMIKLLNNYLRAKQFEELKTPIIIAASNINTGKCEYFSKGELIKPLVASASIPILFNPVNINDNYFIDGGVLDNFPIKTVEKKAEKIIGVFVNPVNYQDNFNNIKNIAVRSFQISINKNMHEESKKCDIFIAPSKLNNYGVLEIDKNEEIFEIGYKEAIKILNKSDLSFL
ncbi:MAG: patatin-like phospholipase family protein [Bacteroidales bacterium]|nr:patatin-like phospholipase family protein [Bacteroidales bacterium]